MPKLDRALYAFAATMILLAAVGHSVFLTPHLTRETLEGSPQQHSPVTPTFEGSLVV